MLVNKNMREIKILVKFVKEEMVGKEEIEEVKVEEEEVGMEEKEEEAEESLAGV